MDELTPGGGVPDRFWIQHVLLGISMSTVVLVVTAIYLLTTPGLPARGVLWVALGLGAVITGAAALLPWRRIIATGSPERLLFAWSLALIPLIVVLAALDLGPTSPMAALLVLPLVFAAMAYPVRSTIGIGLATVTGQLVIALSVPPVGIGDTVIRVAILLMIAVMGALIARNHQHALARAEVLATRLERLASVDGLTGCLNHRGFHERLEAEAARAGRGGLPLSLLVLDLDHFKAINDTFGHPVGDEVLSDVGRTLRGLVRRSDVVGRLGGEEFAVLLPDTDAEAAHRFGERVREAVRDRGEGVPVTVSIGVATLDGSAGRTEQLRHDADQALYAAKHAGRDRVVTAGR
jgi:diguanylate cyclase (GGDEF)-like protein